MSMSGISGLDKDLPFQVESSEGIHIILPSGFFLANTIAQRVLAQSPIKPPDRGAISSLSSRSISLLSQTEFQNEAPAAAPGRWTFVDESMADAEYEQRYDQSPSAYKNVKFEDVTFDDLETYEQLEKADRSVCSEVYYQAHKEEILAKQAEWYQAHKEEKKAKSAAYRQAHKDELRKKSAERGAAYRKAHKEEKKAYLIAYRLAHRDEIREKDRLRYAAKKVARQLAEEI